MVDELEALRYCVHVLDARCTTDAESAWLWKIKRKVALYFIHRLEIQRAGSSSWISAFIERLRRDIWGPPQKQSTARSRDRDRAANLADEEKKLLLQTHPLLQHSTAPSHSQCSHEYAAWCKSIRTKVAKLSESWKISERATELDATSGASGKAPRV